MKRTSPILRSLKPLRLLLASVGTAALLASCASMPEKKHVYDYGDEDVDTKPFSQPEAYEGNPFGNMPQSR